MIMDHQVKNESLGHILGKEVVSHFFSSQSFWDIEIKDEYPIIFPTGRIRIIDMVAISIPLGKKYAYEVGELNGGSIEELYYLFDKCEVLSKLDLESQMLRDILTYLQKELEYHAFEKSGNPYEKIYKYTHRIFLKQGWEEIDEEIIEEYVEEEIEFLYKRVKLKTEYYERIKSRLMNYYTRKAMRCMHELAEYKEEFNHLYDTKTQIYNLPPFQTSKTTGFVGS